MIRSFKSRALSALWHRADTSGIRPDLVARIRLRLDALNSARQPEAVNVSGFNFHKLRGKPVRYTIHVNGPWCITFEWDSEDAVRVDLDQYH
jgi:proteic killer suppression protein